MNKDNAKDYLPLVQALADGKTIQVKVGDDKWHDMLFVHFDSNASEYRIKPEPRVFWLQPQGVWVEDNSEYWRKDGDIKVREVME